MPAKLRAGYRCLIARLMALMMTPPIIFSILYAEMALMKLLASRYQRSRRTTRSVTTRSLTRRVTRRGIRRCRGDIVDAKIDDIDTRHRC